VGGSRFLELNDFDNYIGSIGEKVSFVFLIGGLSGFFFSTRFDCFDGSLNYVGKDLKGSWFLDWRVYLPIYSILKLFK